MSIFHSAFRGAVWLTTFKAISQAFSWTATLIVARILLPQDYGLMEMATILTGYVVLFAELGLGAAIVQREEIQDSHLSSLFWFIVLWGFVLGLSCIVIAYPTVKVFGEPRIFRITQAVSILFVVSSFVIVPRNLLHRELKFKTVGFIDATAVTISCFLMVIIAWMGGGVWTLIGGHIIREFVRAVLLFFMVSWKPRLHMNLNEIKPYLKFGINFAGARSLYYVYSKSDRFFGGRVLGATSLGFYSLALQLASIPMDKFISLLNSVSFPVFSRCQNDHRQFNDFYLRFVNIIAFITAPVYLGGFFIADDLIPLLLGPKWSPAIFPFKILCIAQLVFAITEPNVIANSAQGRPSWDLYMGIVSVLLLPFSFYLASQKGLNWIAVPWVTIHPLIASGFTLITIRKLGISFTDYMRSLMHPALATGTMLTILLLSKQLYLYKPDVKIFDLKMYVFFIILIGATSYTAYIFAFQRRLLYSLYDLWKTRR